MYALGTTSSNIFLALIYYIGISHLLYYNLVIFCVKCLFFVIISTRMYSYIIELSFAHLNTD